MILHLTLKRQWFDLILSGVKKQEYREIKRYWRNYLVAYKNPAKIISTKENCWRYLHQDKKNFFKKYDIVRFTNGYGKHLPSFDIELKSIEIGVGNKEWGAPEEPVFILNLGKLLSTKNIK